MVMDPEANNMGRNPGILDDEVFEIMKSSNRPVWSARDIADNSTVTRPTAAKRLKKMADAGDLETVEIGNATVYYLAGRKMKPVSGGEYAHIKTSLRREYEDKFIGLASAPWETGADKPVEPGERVQLRVDGNPGSWRTLFTTHYDNRRKELHYEETTQHETEALISGEVYERPTVPIEHTDYPDDYDLEKQIGGPDGPKIVGDPPVQGLLLGGMKNYLCRPANDAKFIRDIEIEWVNPGDGEDPPVVDLSRGFEETDEEADGWDPEEAFPPTYADIVALSGYVEPKRAYLEERKDGDGYDVIPADMAGEEIEDYEPTDEFKNEVRTKAHVDGPLHFGGGS